MDKYIILALCMLPLVFGAPAAPLRRPPPRAAYNRPAYGSSYRSPYPQPYGSSYGTPYPQPYGSTYQSMGSPCGQGAPCGQPIQMSMPAMPAMPFPQMPMQQPYGSPYGAPCSPMCASYPLAYQAGCCKRSQKS